MRYATRDASWDRRRSSASRHTIASQLDAAILAGAGYLGVGPVFPSATKEFSEPELAGLGYVRLAAHTTSLPWFAIGGITEKNVDRVLEAGASGSPSAARSCAQTAPAEPSRASRRGLKESIRAMPMRIRKRDSGDVCSARVSGTRRVSAARTTGAGYSPSGAGTPAGFSLVESTSSAMRPASMKCWVLSSA